MANMAISHVYLPDGDRSQDNLSGGKWFVLQDGPGVADFHIWEMWPGHA